MSSTWEILGCREATGAGAWAAGGCWAAGAAEAVPGPPALWQGITLPPTISAPP